MFGIDAENGKKLFKEVLKHWVNRNEIAWQEQAFVIGMVIPRPKPNKQNAGELASKVFIEVIGPVNVTRLRRLRADLANRLILER